MDNESVATTEAEKRAREIVEVSRFRLEDEDASVKNILAEGSPWALFNFVELTRSIASALTTQPQAEIRRQALALANKWKARAKELDLKSTSAMNVKIGKEMLTVANVLENCAADIRALASSAPKEDKAPQVVFAAIDSALNSYRCTHSRELADPDNGSALIDVLTPEGDNDVKRGREELDSLIDYVCGEVLGVSQGG